MVRPSIRTNYWLSIISGTALLVCILSSPSGTMQTPRARVSLDSLSLKSVHTLDGARGALSSAMPGPSLSDAHRSAFIEEEDEPSCSSPLFVSPAFIEPSGPPKAFAGPLPGNSPSRIAILPLRC